MVVLDSVFVESFRCFCWFLHLILLGSVWGVGASSDTIYFWSEKLKGNYLSNVLATENNKKEAISNNRSLLLKLFKRTFTAYTFHLSIRIISNPLTQPNMLKLCTLNIEIHSLTKSGRFAFFHTHEKRLLVERLAAYLFHSTQLRFSQPQNRSEISFATSLKGHPQSKRPRTSLRSKLNCEYVNTMVIEFTIMCDITSTSTPCCFATVTHSAQVLLISTKTWQHEHIDWHSDIHFMDTTSCPPRLSCSSLAGGNGTHLIL